MRELISKFSPTPQCPLILAVNAFQKSLLILPKNSPFAAPVPGKPGLPAPTSAPSIALARALVPGAGRASARGGMAPARVAADGTSGLLEGKVGRRKRRSLGEENLCIGEECWAYTGQRAGAVPARGCGGEGCNREIAALSQNEGQAEKTDEQIGKLLPAQATTTVLSLNRDKWLIHIFFSCSNHSSNHIPNRAHPVAPAFWQTAPNTLNTPRFPCLAFRQHSAGREKLRLWFKGCVTRASSAHQPTPWGSSVRALHLSPSRK